MKRIRKYRVLLYFLDLVLIACGTACQQATDKYVSPYPPSPVISKIDFDWSTHEQQAPGSDNWPITWADDDHQYASWGDGGGFGGRNRAGRVSLGVARIEGGSDDYSGHNVWGGLMSEHPARFMGKSYGIISIDGSLYMWVSPGSDKRGYEEARLAISRDHGASWNQVDWAFTKADGIVMPTFLQFGKDYADARDCYVYSWFIRLQNDSRLSVQKPGKIDLARVGIGRIPNRDAYEFYAGLDNDGEPLWSSNIADKQPVFQDSNGVGWNASVSYNAGLNRYLLITEHGQSAKGNLGMFDAPKPWGPWTTVTYDSNWMNTRTTFFWNFANKWLSPDGKSFTLVFTGTDSGSHTYDSWNTVRGNFSILRPIVPSDKSDDRKSKCPGAT